MNESIKPNEDKNQILKSIENKSNKIIPKNNLFISQKMNISENDKNPSKKHIRFINF